MFSKAICKAADDFDEFLAPTQIAEQRKELKSICSLNAAPSTWGKFIAYEGKMQMRRKHEAEERHCQIAQTIRYIPWGLRIAINEGGLCLLYFSPSFCEVQFDNSGNLNRL